MHLWVSGHEGVHVVVDQLEDEASVHQVEAALQVEKEEVVSTVSLVPNKQRVAQNVDP